MVGCRYRYRYRYRYLNHISIPSLKPITYGPAPLIPVHLRRPWLTPIATQGNSTRPIDLKLRPRWVLTNRSGQDTPPRVTFFPPLVAKNDDYFLFFFSSPLHFPSTHSHSRSVPEKKKKHNITGSTQPSLLKYSKSYSMYARTGVLRMNQNDSKLCRDSKNLGNLVLSVHYQQQQEQKTGHTSSSTYIHHVVCVCTCVRTGENNRHGTAVLLVS